MICLLYVLLRRDRIKVLQASIKLPPRWELLQTTNSRKLLGSVLRRAGLRGCEFVLGVLAAEALYAASGIHKLLLSCKERMAGRADFNADIALMGGAGNKGIAARAVHANFVISGMNGCFHGV